MRAQIRGLRGGAERATREAAALIAATIPTARPRRNAKINPLNQYRELRAALLNRTEAMCDICQYLAQDYICLGFRFPDACLRPACARAAGRPPLLVRALRLDCNRLLWPPQCVEAFPDRGQTL